MKQLKILTGLVLLLCLAVPAVAQDMTAYGSPLNIVIPEDSESLWEKYNVSRSIEDQAEWERVQGLESMTFPQAWSPDGQWIVFCGGTNRLYITTPEGGEPRLLYENYQYELGEGVNARRWYNSLLALNGASFTPDSQELTFTRRHYDEDKGSDVTITNGDDGSYSASFRNPIRTIESINIHTGEHRVIGDGENPKWSSDGRYLCYINFDYRQYIDSLQAENDGGLAILDTETGEKWFLTDGSDNIVDAHFTPDDSAVIFSMALDDKYKKVQFFRIPLAGGEIEQISFEANGGDGTGNARMHFDMSPDGEWLL